MDYQGLNNITRKDQYPLPLIKETLNGISKARYFTKLDITAAFHKIRIAKGQEWITAFRTHYKLFEYLITPFGLTGAPATFQRYINWVLRDYLDKFCTAYVDNILIYTSGSLQNHRAKVHMVLGKLREAKLTLNINKYQFKRKQVKYLRFIIKAGVGLQINPEKTKAIRE